MRTLLAVFLLFSFTLNAKTLKGKIESVDQGFEEKPHLIFVDTGVVLFLDTTKDNLFKSILESKKTNKMIQFEVDQNQNLLSTMTIRDVRPSVEMNYTSHFDVPYYPTIVEDVTAAFNIMQKMRSDYRDDQGQCYNMAHVWAYEEFKRSDLHSMKLFMFFTTKYVREYRYTWWFHATPLVYVDEITKVAKMTLDRRYTVQPLYIKDWTDNFIKSKRECKLVKKLAQVNRDAKVEDCYLIETDMHILHTRDIRSRDLGQTLKEGFIKTEVEYARTEAFKGGPSN
jgi:hypothetical protein